MNVKGIATGIITALIAVLIVLAVVGETTDDIQDYGDDVNDTGAPLAGLFASDSIVPLMWIAGALVALIGLIFGAYSMRS